MSEYAIFFESGGWALKVKHPGGRVETLANYGSFEDIVRAAYRITGRPVGFKVITKVQFLDGPPLTATLLYDPPDILGTGL